MKIMSPITSGVMTKILVLFGLILCASAFSADSKGSGSSDTNLVLNGDFEEIVANQPSYWSKNAWMMDAAYTNIISEQKDPFSGKYYVTIDNIKSNDTRLYQTVEVKPSTVYLLSCYVRASNIPKEKNGANICATASTDVPPAGFNECSANYTDTAGKWQYVELAVKTGPLETSLTVAIRLGGYGSDTMGKASFDRFRLEEVKDSSQPAPRTLVSGTVTRVQQSTNLGIVVIVIIAVVLFAGIAAFLVFALSTKKKKDGNGKDQGMKSGQDKSNADKMPPAGDEPPLLLKKQNGAFTRNDFLIAGALTIVYGILAFTNLGSCEAPTTYWRPTARGENVTVDFGSPQVIRRIYYWQGLPGGFKPNESKYEVEGSMDGRDWQHITILNPKTIFWWYFETTSTSARFVKITVDVPGSWLNEVVFLGNDQNNPIKIASVAPGPKQRYTEGTALNIFDEYSDVGGVKAKKHLEYRPTIMTGMSPGFDEQYHGRTAMEHIKFRTPYEDTHPPLGKMLIAAGVLIFGMTPFGWRFMGTFLGILMIPFMFAFGKKLFKKTEYAFFSAFLMMFDFMHFTQTRIATIDTYGVFFIILMYYFMFRYCEMSFITTEFKKMLVPLLLSGICWGLGAAAKWTAIYAGIGLLVIFFVDFFKKADEVRVLKNSKGVKKSKEEWAVIQAKINEYPKRKWQILGWCVLVFVIIPAILYFLAYVPILMVSDPNIHMNPKWVLQSQYGMYDYHSKVKQAHSYSSLWWQWPIMTKPMAYYFADGLPADKTQRLFAFGNPAIWWIGSFLAIIVTLASAVLYIKRSARNIYASLKNKHSKSAKLILTILLTITFIIFISVIAPGTIGGFLTFIPMLIYSIYNAAAAPGKAGMYIGGLFAFIAVLGAFIGIVIAALRSKKSSAVIYGIFDDEKGKDEARFVIVVGVLSNYLPWVVSPRTLTFIYHFFPTVPFLILAIVYCVRLLREKVLDPLREKGPQFGIYAISGNVLIYLYFAIVLALFIMFYPVTAGVPADTNYIKSWLMWFPGSWYFG